MHTWTARWTIGIDAPENQHTGISPTSMRDFRFDNMRRSPREKVGAMEFEVTTTQGFDDRPMMHSDFQIMNGVASSRRRSKRRARVRLRACVMV